MAGRKRVNARKPPGRKNKFKKLRGLTCYNDVYDRLCQGWPIAQVAKYIQEERGEYQDISRGGLESQLKNFRAEMPPGDLVQKRFPEVFEEAKAEVQVGLDELREMEELYRLQMHRVGIDFKNEKTIGKLLPSTTGDIREARQILESLVEMKMDLGVLGRAGKRVDLNVDVDVEANLTGTVVQQFGDEAVKKVLENAESRRKVMGVMERFMKLPEKASK